LAFPQIQRLVNNRMSLNNSQNSFANWHLLDDLTIPITAPDYVLQALKERINISFDGGKNARLNFQIIWNTSLFEQLKKHFWNDELGPEHIVEYKDSEKHLFLGSSHYELLNLDTGILEFYSTHEVYKLYNQYSYPFLRWIGLHLNTRGFAPIHAAAIGDSGHYVLIPGKASAGKSTTTATWMINGGDYLSDDFVYLSGNLARGFYRGINLRKTALSLFTDTLPSLQLREKASPDKDEKVFLHDQQDKSNHKQEGRVCAIWCPEIGHSEPHLRKISVSTAYNSLFSSIQLNKEFHFDLRMCHQAIKSIVHELPAYALCLTDDVSVNYKFMREAMQPLIKESTFR